MHKLIQINQVSLFILWKALGVPCIRKQQFVMHCSATALHSITNCLKIWSIPKMFHLNISAIKSYWTVAFINFLHTRDQGMQVWFFFSFLFSPSRLFFFFKLYLLLANKLSLFFNKTTALSFGPLIVAYMVDYPWC